jgi:type IV pilus assembly protein PilA
MKMKQSTKGFTLVEIMIVVVIIGLLAAMAIPAFQKVRRDSYRKTMVNDARLVVNAAQQYFMDNSVTYVPLTTLVGPATSNYVKSMSNLNTFSPATLTSDSAFSCTVSNALVGTSALTFDNEGHLSADPYK